MATEPFVKKTTKGKNILEKRHDNVIYNTYYYFLNDLLIHLHILKIDLFFI